MAVLEQEITERYAVYCGDCNDVMAALPSNSVHLSVYSPPFAGLYTYSSNERDLSNARSYAEFMEHYDYVVREIHRVTLPGRMTAVHCADVPTGNTGCDATIDFPGDLSELHQQCRDPRCSASRWERKQGTCGHGLFERVARYHVWKEPLAVRNRTMTKSLSHKGIVEDSSRCSVASADYVLVLRKRGKNPVPIAHPEGLMEYAGSREIPRELLRYRGWTGNQIENRYSHWIWRQYASAFWDDVRIDRVLPYKEARDAEDEKHVHPLQLDVIDRILTLWSNPGETVLSPFGGVGSEPYAAVCAGRRAVAAELKPSYYRQMVKNLATAGVRQPDQPDLWQGAATHEDHPETVEIQRGWNEAERSWSMEVREAETA